MQPSRVACAFFVVSVVTFAGCNPNPCAVPLPPSPPVPPLCYTTGFNLYLSAFPDTGDLQPDYLVRSGTTVNVDGFAFQQYDCPQPDGSVTHGVRRPDFLWQLEYVPRGGAKKNVTNLLTPPSGCLAPTFVASRGTWRLTLYLVQHPDVAKTITIEAADPDDWVHIGPDGRVLDCASGSCMGRMAGIAFDPEYPARMFAAAPRGGIFRSDEAAAWWYPMSDHKIVDGNTKEWAGGLATTRVVVLPNQHIVAATCDTDWFGSGSTQGCDPNHLFYRSTDLGVTWTQSGTSCTDPNEQDTPSGPVVEFFGDPASGSLFTVAGGSIYRSRSEGNCWRRIDPPPSLLGGLKLVAGTVQALSFIDATRHFLYVAASPFDSKAEYSLGQILFNTADSEALDPTWTAASVGASAQGSINAKGMSSIARVHMANGAGSVYLVVPVSPAAKGVPYGVRLFRGDVAGGLPTFQRTQTDPPTTCGDCDWYDLTIAANDNAPAFAKEVAVAGGAIVVDSVDGGDSWTSLSEPHVDHHFLAFDPSGTRLWSSSDGGIASIDLPNGSWIDRNYGLNTSMAYSSSISGTDPNHAITGIGLQDNGNFARKSAGRVWDKISGCDGFQITFDAGSINSAYEGPLNCGRALYRNDLRTNIEVGFGGAQFFRADRYKPGRVFGIYPRGATGYQLYIADNLNTQNTGSATWRCADPQPTLKGETVSALLTLPGDPELPLVTNTAGDVWRTDLTKIAGTSLCGANDTAGSPIYTTQPLPKAAITDIALDPQDNKSFYVAVLRDDAQHVVHLVYDPQSTSWTPVPLGQGLPATSLDPSTNRIAADPKAPATLYFGTDVGLFKGNSTPSTAWASVFSVPNTMVTNVMTANGTSCDSQGVLRVATYGRGVYERFFSTGAVTPTCPGGPSKRGPTPLTIRPDGAEGHFYPAPTAHVRIEYDLPERATSDSELRIRALRRGEAVREIEPVAIRLGQRRGMKLVTLSPAKNATELTEVDQIEADVVTRGGEVVASSKAPIRIRFRGEAMRALRVSASRVVEGGPVSLPNVNITIGGKSFQTPLELSLPSHRGLLVEVPSTVILPDGTKAQFAGWVGSSFSASDWTKRSALPSDPMSRRIKFVLNDDAEMDVRYLAPTVGKDDTRRRP